MALTVLGAAAFFGSGGQGVSAPVQSFPPADWRESGVSLRARTGAAGSAVATGDVNVDGFDDLIVGMPDSYTKISNPGNDYGRVVVYRGSTNGLVRETGPTNWFWEVQGQVLNGEFGRAVAAGDVDNDGATDILVAGNSVVAGDFKGKVYIYKGGNGTTPGPTPAWTYAGTTAWQSVGRVTCLADFNGDGRDDIAISDGSFFTAAYRVLVFYAGESSIPTTPSWTFTFSNDFGETVPGAAAALCGADVNGDGIKDLVIGSPFEGSSTESAQRGKLYVFYGSATGLKLSPSEANADNVIVGDQPAFGSCVANGGKVNGDAVDDIVVGEPQFGNTKAYVYFGSAGVGLSSFLRVELVSDGGDNPFWGRAHGSAVASVGRFNDDAYDDIAVGDFSYTTLDPFGGCDPELDPTCATNEIKGKVFVYYGSENAQISGFTVDASFGHPHTVLDSMYGDAIASGRFHGDVGGDLVVGAPKEGAIQNLGGNGLGAVYVYNGFHPPLSVPPHPPFGIQQIGVVSNGVVLAWPGVSNYHYAVWHTTNLLDGFTHELTNGLIFTPPMTVHTINVSIAGSHFFKTVVETHAP